MRRLILAVGVCLCTQAAAAEEPFHGAKSQPLDVQNIRLDLDVDLKAREISGSATIDFRPLQSLHNITLDAVDHEVDAVEQIGGGSPQSLPFHNTGEQLLVEFPQPLKRGEDVRIKIGYRVRDPQSGMYFFGPSESSPNVPWMVWTQGEPNGNRFWFPSFDHPNEKQTTEIVATVDAGFEALSNGSLVSREEAAEGTKTRFHWKQEQPHVSYLVTLVVGEFTVVQEEWRGIPVTYYVEPHRAADVQRTFGRTVEMLDFFSDRFGIQYPWEKYAQVVVEQFIVGGMENTSATTLTQRVMHDERASLDSSPDGLIAHELGHQWWGDLLTCKDWTHLWGALAIDTLKDFSRKDLKGKTVVTIVSGGNFDFERLPDVKERALRFEGLKKYFVFRFPQRPGALRDFLELLGPEDDIVRFEYLKKSARNFGSVLIGIETRNRKNFAVLEKRFEAAGWSYQDITDNEVLAGFII